MRLIIVFLIVTLSSCIALNQSNLVSAYNPVVAHRGAFKKLHLPENSIASLKQAIALGCTGTEFDVHMTSDDVLVLNHDADYFKIPIEKNSYAVLNQNKLSNGEPLPLLKKALEIGMRNNKSTKLVCEIKTSTISKERSLLVAERVVKMVKDMHAEDYMVYISFDFDILNRILMLNPKANTQYLNGDKTPAELKQAGIKGADYHLSVFQKNPEWIKTAKDLHIDLNAWTVNEEKDMKWLIEKRFEFITTNEPERLLELIKSTK